jgi:hypothetical protein
VQDEPVVRVAAKGLRHDFLKLCFDFLDGLARCEAGSVADAKDVRIDRERFLPKRGVEHYVGGLAADAGKFLELLPGARHFTAVVVDQHLRQSDDIFCLGIEQANGLDRVAQPFLAEIDHLARRFDAGEQRTRRHVDAGVGRLRGKHDGHEQLVGTGRFELSRRGGIGLREAAEEFENLFAVHSAPITSRIA